MLPVGNKNDYDMKRFLRDVPINVFRQILEQIPPTIVEIILEVPELRQTIIDIYYLNEIHFILAPTKRPHSINLPEDVKRLVCIESYYEIEEFLLKNPDINPAKWVVATGADFESLRSLLNKFRQRVVLADSLEIIIERYEPSNDDLELILSFSNLRTLHFSRAKLNKCLKSLDNISKSNLNLLVLLGHRIDCWNCIGLPQTLRQLDISWNEHTNVNTISLPPTISHIYWNQAGITNTILQKQVFLETLKVLMLTYNNISNFNISLLPRSLETIDLSYNLINEFDEGSEWPPNLKSILLSNNLIDDLALMLLSRAQWPETLEVLKLDSNPFTDISGLENLPNKLQYLDVSYNRIKSFETAHNGLFKFPSDLKELNLYNSQDLTFSDSARDPFKRLQFPQLTSLNLSECNLIDLSFFELPNSLQKLSLAGNKISNLATYNLKINGHDIYNWSQLTNLKELELYFNRILTVDGWCPPPGLKRLDLRLNGITSLTSQLFNKSIQSLDLGGNKISYIEVLELPTSLRALCLNDNDLSGSFKIFKPSQNLERLDLSGNRILELTIPYRGDMRACEVDLLGNIILKDHSTSDIKDKVAQFYFKLEEGLGCKVKKHKFNVNSLHILE
ncbi:uncharacterized protein PRCAT00004115001 [Priceomyces carsonii]|uniref:uncharacterized protein n=1 Tax=Priceomyces carsonii TaxID=28549 RepID=UPI002ED9874F|nr:unnamed protein product [Priceomyces carsonii]